MEQRKLSRAERRRAGREGEINDGPKILRPSRYVPAAEFPASQGDNLIVPHYWAIKSRTLSSEKLRAHRSDESADPNTMAQDASHSFQNDRMTEARKFMLPFFQAAPASANESSLRVKIVPNAINNIFSTLGIIDSQTEEINELLEGLWEDEYDEVPESLDDAHLEASICFRMMIPDYTTVQESIKGVWLQYSEGKLNIAAAAITTNTAIDLARHMEEQATEIIQKFAELHVTETDLDGLSKHLKEKPEKSRGCCHMETGICHFVLKNTTR